MADPLHQTTRYRPAEEIAADLTDGLADWRGTERHTTAVTDDEIRRCLKVANREAAFMGCKVLPVARKLRAAGASEDLIEELMPADGSMA